MVEPFQLLAQDLKLVFILSESPVALLIEAAIPLFKFLQLPPPVFILPLETADVSIVNVFVVSGFSFELFVLSG